MIFVAIGMVQLVFMEEKAFNLTSLPNGFKVLTVPMDGVQSVAAMVWVAVGSRYETAKMNGVAHFLEHMVFKGTQKYRNQDIISRTIEGVGGLLNAYTSLEYTAYFCKVTKKFYPLGLDLVSQLALYPTLPQKEIAKEAGNVIEEINRYEDMPDRKAMEVFYKCLYPNQPIGRDISGTKETVRAIRRSDFLEFRSGHYSPDKMTLVVAGAVTAQEVARQAERIFGALPKVTTEPALPVAEKQKSPVVEIYFKETTAQAHICLGARAFPHNDSDKYSLMVLNAVLGEGMSSRLFINVRNKKGLAYAVSSEADLMTDTGLWYAYAGLNAQKVEKGLAGIMEEMKKVRETRVPEKELSEAKEKIRGPLLFMLEQSGKLAEYFGRKAVVQEELLGPDQEAEKIMAVTAEDVREVAQRLFVDQRLNLAVVGNYKDGERERFLKLLRI